LREKGGAHEGQDDREGGSAAVQHLIEAAEEPAEDGPLRRLPSIRSVMRGPRAEYPPSSRARSQERGGEGMKVKTTVKAGAQLDNI